MFEPDPELLSKFSNNLYAMKNVSSKFSCFDRLLKCKNYIKNEYLFVMLEPAIFTSLKCTCLIK